MQAADSTIKYPISANDAIKIFGNVYLNDYEKQEINKFDGEIYYLGENCKRKIKGHVISSSKKSPEYI